MIPTEQPLPQIEAVVERQAEASAVPRPDPLGIEDVPTQARSKVRLIAVICGLYASLFIAALDQVIVSTAIPTISSDFNSASGYTWIGGAYLLANAAAGPIWVKLSDIWGRKPILLTSVIAFAASSVICAASKSMNMLIVGRALQGSAGGGVIQLVTIVISDLFSVRRRTLFFGLLEIIWAVAAGIGPVLGGVFSQLVSWRWIFWINLPFSGITVVLLFFSLDVHNPRTKLGEGLRAIDWLGCLSILGLTVMFLLGLNFGGTVFPWSSAKVICLIIFGALMSICFIVSEKKFAQYPVMPLHLFSNTATAACLLVGFFQGFVYIAAEYYLPLYFQSVLQASPVHSGVLILPATLTEAFAGISAGLIMHRTSRYRELMWIGTALMTIGNGLFIHFNTNPALAQIIISQIVAGLGVGMLFTPPIIALQVLVSQDETATSTATYGFIRNLATSSSIVIGGVVFQNGMSRQNAHLKAAGLSPDMLKAFSGDAAAANVMMIDQLANSAQVAAVKQAFSWSLRNLWIMYTCISFLAIAASLFTVQRTLSKEHEETKTGLKKPLQAPEQTSS